ncbi:hypothetical protein BO71DRAFT_7340 [Aspergillus ellipticus CBS 707.79]|uniref:Uncharacterized protein n=1 Tax=Aspergillus ellipticus CBS 707.79 TaxID=1448320 RepID=A0A319DY41_9EURO|nr:hypothetical protein BO71DRAFT_7340 [Aspergillus ellipticus CBS 707.79]
MRLPSTLLTLTTTLLLVPTATPAPVPLHHAARSLSSILNINWSQTNALKALNEVMSQLPLDVDIWALNRTEGVVGVNVDLDVGEMAALGLVSLGSERARNARINMNVTVTGLA